MNRIKASGSGSYQAARDVNVQNFFGVQNDHIAWIVGFARAVNEPIIAFDESLQVIYMNNAWGTFEDTNRIRTPDDVLNNIDHLYYNSSLLIKAIKDSARLVEPRNLCLHMVNGLDVICRCQPVANHGLFAGLIVAAWKQDNTTKPKPATSTLKIVE